MVELIVAVNVRLYSQKVVCENTVAGLKGSHNIKNMR
jgi:hypothetical protein